jgi:hypothetical protein
MRQLRLLSRTPLIFLNARCFSVSEKVPPLGHDPDRRRRFGHEPRPRPIRSNIPSIPIHPEGDKIIRMSAQTAKIEAGAVHLPRQAPWLDDLRTEVLAFPLAHTMTRWIRYRRP